MVADFSSCFSGRFIFSVVVSLKRLLAPLPLVFLLISSHAWASKVEILPNTISPGDVFAVKISGHASHDAPVVSFLDARLPVTGCGTGCFLAIGATTAETKPGKYRVSVTGGQQKVVRNVSVKRASFPTVSIQIPEKKVAPAPEEEERVRNEQLLLDALWQKVSGKMWSGRFTMPLGNELSTRYGTRRLFNGKLRSVHQGLDIRGGEGEAIKASNGGTVVLAQELFYGGNTVVIDHGLGIFTVYMHLSAYAVTEGETVANGQIVGFVGATGRASGPHLHFGVKVADKSVNPLSLMKLTF